MKRLTAIILSALLLLTVFAFTSCDQASVDSTLDNLINTGKDLLGPFFKIAESSSSNTDNSGADINPDTGSSLDSQLGGEGTTDTEPENDTAAGGTTDGEPNDATNDGGAADNDSAK